MAFAQYKVVEISNVTDVDVEAVLNEWSSKGWILEGIQFAMRESSKRPAMAFVLFTKSAKLRAVGDDSDDDDGDA